MMCMNVDLPDPDGPVTARNSPRSTSRSTPRNARTSTSPTTYVLTRFLTEMTVGMNLPASSRPAALTRHERIAGAAGWRSVGRTAPSRMLVTSSMFCCSSPLSSSVLVPSVMPSRRLTGLSCLSM